jgi:hypothetical protein
MGKSRKKKEEEKRKAKKSIEIHCISVYPVK